MKATGRRLSLPWAAETPTQAAPSHLPIDRSRHMLRALVAMPLPKLIRPICSVLAVPWGTTAPR